MRVHVLLINDSDVLAAAVERRRGASHVVRAERLALEAPALPLTARGAAEYGAALAERVAVVFGRGLHWRAAVPTAWCTIREVDTPPTGAGSEAVAFAFEALVPYAIEDLTWVSRGVGVNGLQVTAVATEPVAAMLTAMQDGGVWVDVLTASAFVVERLLAAESAAGGLVAWADARHGCTAWLDTECARLVRIRSRLVGGGARCEAAAADDGLLSGRAGEPVAMRVTLATCGQVASGVGGPACGDAEHAAQGGGAVSDAALSCALAEDGHPDLRLGGLACAWREEGLLRAVRSGCCVVAVLAVLFGAGWRLERRAADRATAELRATMSDVYAEVFPGKAPPPGAAAVVASHRRTLEGLTGARGADAAWSASADPLTVLGQVVAALPGDVKLNVSELAFDAGAVRLAGRTTSHNAAGEIVRAINTVPGLQSDPPQTRLREDDSVDVRIHIRSGGDS